MAELPEIQFSMSMPARRSDAPLRVLAAGAVAQGVEAFARFAHRTAGIALQLQFGNGTKIVRRLQAGDAFDVLIAAPSGIEIAATLGRLVQNAIAPVGRVGVGAVVAASVPVPDVSTIDALRRAILDADSIVYNTATSGTTVEAILVKMGLQDAIRAKTVRCQNGPAVMHRVAEASGRALGFGAVTEIHASRSLGLQLAGVLPDELDPYTAYAAAIMAGSANEMHARTLLELMTSPAGRAAFASQGIA